MTTPPSRDIRYLVIVSGVVVVTFYMHAARYDLSDGSFLVLLVFLSGLLWLSSSMTSSRRDFEGFVASMFPDSLLSLPGHVRDILVPSLDNVAKAFKGEGGGEEKGADEAVDDVTLMEEDYARDFPSPGGGGEGGFRVNKKRFEAMKLEYAKLDFLMCRLKSAGGGVYNRFLKRFV